MEKLSQILWRERELLETLLFKLEVRQSMLAGGSTRWLARSTREVENVLQVIGETEVLRAVVAEAAATGRGLAGNPSLRALAEAADEPWRSLLLDHRDAFRSVAHEIGAFADVKGAPIAMRHPAGAAPWTGRPTLRRVVAAPIRASGKQETGPTHDRDGVVDRSDPMPDAVPAGRGPADLPRTSADVQLPRETSCIPPRATSRVVQSSLVDFLR